MRKCRIFSLTHSGSSIWGLGSIRNARSKQEAIGCFIFHTQRWIFGLSLEWQYIVVFWCSPIIWGMCWSTCEWSIADIRYQDTSPRTACKQERCKYDDWNSLPHWLMQWASSTMMQFIFFFIFGSFQMCMNWGSTASSGERTMVQNCIHLIS